MNRRKLMVLACVLGVVLLAGCFGPSEGELDGDMSEDEFDAFIEDREAAEQELETHTMSMEMDISVDDGPSTGMSVDGAINDTATEGWAEYDMTGTTGPGQPSNFEAYFDDVFVYTDTGDDEWERLRLDDLEDDNTEEFWDVNETTATEEHYYYGDVSVEDDGDTISVTTELDGDEMEAALGESGEDVSSLQGWGSASFEDVTIEEEIDAETNLPLTVDMEGEISEGDDTATFSMQSEYDDHDEDVDAEIPDDVRDNAEDASGIHHPMT
ncbi:DUF6612 family protein [Natronorubrum daqingense]|uniref:Uncharacterized protein n=2 Tax=Natronorubrum daqingense TaxID=588898 RepID=A0A1N7C4M4_9EURY|nr:DUF6612 family protein [Natronorubrum daqingense]SIR58403.1 hypothetical protein SAMN05421809_1509 [Natronorubrum daqingense]